MAAAPAPDYGALYGDATLWTDPTPDYVALTGVLGNAATDRAATQLGVVNLAQRTPTAVAFVLTGDDQYIYVGHTPSQYPADPLTAQAFDNHLVVLVGRMNDAVAPVILPPEAFERTANARCGNIGLITGATGHAAAPPVLRLGPHPLGTANTDEVRCRRAMILPPAVAAAAIEGKADGRYGLAEFYALFLDPPLAAGGDPATEIAPLVEWYRVASTIAGGGGNTPAIITSVQPATPHAAAALNNWSNGIRHVQMARLGVGGPGLTTAAFNAGINNLTNTLTNANQATIDYHRNAAVKTFADEHGPALAQRIMNLCSVVDEVNLPEVHTTLVNTPKARECAVIGALFAERAETSPLPISTANVPLATTRLVDDVFRSYAPGGTGLIFGKGLSPFSIVCEGHKEATQAKALATNAARIESGTSTSLADVQSITTTDIRFPTEAYVAAEKLCGWSIAIDIFHGVNHEISVSIRDAVANIGPCLHRIITQMGDNQSAGMDLICRIMYDMQQDYFQYINQLSRIPAGGPMAAPRVPDFANLQQRVLTYRVDSLSPLPMGWYSLVTAPSNPRALRSPSRNTPRDEAGMSATFNAHADRRLMQRFRDSEHTTISGMLEGHNPEVPKHNDKPVCLTWALKGQCNGTCRRRENHVRYNRTTIQALHRLLDDCGVANPQA